MRVLVTRPAAQAQAWLAPLRAAGYAAESLPLIEITPVPEPAQIAHAWGQWSHWQAVMFVSAAAVEQFFQTVRQHVGSDLTQQLAPSTTRCWATGLGTQKALLQAGVPAHLIDAPAADSAQFDSEALWQRVTAHVQPGRPVLIVRGMERQAVSSPAGEPTGMTMAMGAGRDWLGEQLQHAGVPVHWLVAYQRGCPAWSSAQMASARAAATDGSVWCFSSSQAIAGLGQLLVGQDWSQARCIVTHPRMAEAAQRLGFRDIRLARPLVREVLASLESSA